jgi:cytochrome P450 family 4
MAFLYVIVLCVVAVVAAKTWRFYRTLRRIPSPPGRPIIGNLLQFMSNPDRLFIKARAFSAKYYPIYRLSTFYFTVAVLLDPNDVELVLSSTKHLAKSRVYSYLNQWLGTGLLTSTGEKWHSRRKILTPAFHFDILQQFVATFNDETDKLVRVLEENCGKAPVNVVPIVTNFTLQSIGETAMGFKNAKEEDHLQYKKAVYRIGKIILSRLSRPWLHVHAFYKLSSLGREEQHVVKILRNFTNNIILRREEDTIGGSSKKRLAMLDLLLATKRDGVKIDYEGIREEVDTFMFEGHDTTSMAISFILLTLANQPHAQTRVFDEILQVVGSTNHPTFHDLQALRYTERCIKECLRLFPSVPFISRRAGEDFRTTTGYDIPKDTIMHIHIFDIHRNPVLYPDPLKFDPDRFLPENMSQRHPFAYIPFSAGPRNCIGQRFALLELKAALCGILRRFVLEPVDGMFDVKFRPDLVLRPRQEIRVRLAPRVL